LQLILNKDIAMQDYEQLFSEFLSRRGFKLTTPRRQILCTVFSLHEHFDADQLHERLAKQSQQVSRATIYRTIHLMQEAGLIQQSLRSLSRDVYEHIYGHPRHVHWVCTRCGAVLETSLDELQQEIRQASQLLKFQVDEINLTINGTCWKCQVTENENQ